MPSFRRPISRMVYAGLLLSSACIASPADEAELSSPEADELGEVTQGINGTFNYIGCDTGQKAKLDDAKAIVYSQVRGPDRTALLNCMRDATAAADRMLSPEALLGMLDDDMPTTIRCVDDEPGGDANARGEVGIDHEELRVFKGPLAMRTPKETAGTIIHEVSHNKGWGHGAAGSSPEVTNTIPHQLDICSESISSGNPLDMLPTPRGDIARSNANFLMRSQFQRRAQLALVSPPTTPVNGGTIFPNDSCIGSGTGSTRFARGLSVRWGTGGVTGLNMQCDNFSGPSSPTVTAVRGANSGDTLSSLDCAPNVMIGIQGRMGNITMNAISPVCATKASVQASSSAIVAPGMTPVGISGGTAFTRVCPVGMVVKAIGGWAVNRLRVTCQAYNDTRELRFASTPLLGSTGSGLNGETFDVCPNDGAMTRIVGQTDKDTGKFTRFGGFCQDMKRVNGDLVREADLTKQTILAGRLTPTSDDVSFSSTCATSDAIIGLNYQTNMNFGDIERTVSRISVLCAPTVSWANGITSTIHPLTAVGSAGDTNGGDVKCPASTFMVGWRFHHGIGSTALKGIEIFCRGL